jgi:hypothetical protein
MQKERHIVLRACRVCFDFLKEKGCHGEGKGKMRKKKRESYTGMWASGEISAT